MYTVCYVVSDNEKLRYYNELLISLCSLRKHMYQGNVCVLMDAKTKEILKTQQRDELSQLRAEVLTVDIPSGYTEKEKSRYIKTSLRNYIVGDMLFIDTDTVIADSLPDAISDSDLAMVQESHMSLIEKGVVSQVSLLFEKCGYSLVGENIYFNSGVIWAKDTENARCFFRKWHEAWKQCRARGVVFDQPSLNNLNRIMGNVIAILDGSYNVQISSTPTPIIYLHRAKIIHYYNDMPDGQSPYMLQDRYIQEQGYQSDVVQRIIANPREAWFHVKVVRCDGATEKLLYSNAYNALKWLYLHHRLLYKGISFVLSIPERIQRLFKRK